jgi:predicted metalloprotease
MGLPIGVGGGGLGLIALLAYLLLSSLGGGGVSLDPGLSPFPPAPGAQGEPIPASQDPDRDLKDFMGFLAEDVQEEWARLFAAAKLEYRPANIVLFSGSVQSGCGAATSAVGPFYCPLDGKVYLDFEFFRELSSRFRAPGDVAQAYVIAHEYGHHVQNQLGIDDDVRRSQQEHPDEANELSVRLELQADCFAGVWAHTAYTEGRFEAGEVREALDAAAAVGDDRIQEAARGRSDPESFTHGSAEQRQRWFERGYETGDPNNCNTFEGDV